MKQFNERIATLQKEIKAKDKDRKADKILKDRNEINPLK